MDGDGSKCKQLSGKSAFVTGAGQGIGRGIAEELAAQGARVTIAEVNIETGNSAADEHCALPGIKRSLVRVDIRSED